MRASSERNEGYVRTERPGGRAWRQMIPGPGGSGAAAEARGFLFAAPLALAMKKRFQGMPSVPAASAPTTRRPVMKRAKKIVTALAKQAYREAPSDAAIEELMTAYQKGRNQGDFDSGIRMALQTVLAHPSFVFRFERTPQGIAPPGRHSSQRRRRRDAS